MTPSRAATAYWLAQPAGRRVERAQQIAGEILAWTARFSAHDNSALDEPMTQQWSRDFDNARLELAKLHATTERPLADVWSQVAQIASDTLKVERVGAWILVDGGKALRCRYLQQLSDRQIFHGAVLRSRDFPSYFDALSQQRTIAAHDALEATTTGELREAYLRPLGIGALIDAPIYLSGKVVGVVCHEHVGGPRAWDDTEAAFAACVADNVARIYEEHERQNAQSALRQYRKHLMELHRMEALGRMAAGVAHDFRGIVSAALGFAELLQRTPALPTKAEQYCRRIIESLNRGQQLCKQVMEFGQDEPMFPRVLDVKNVLAEMRDMFKILLGETIELSMQFIDPISRVFMDPSQLERTLLNVVLNARDAMPAGGRISIRVQERHVEEDGASAAYVAITISDTGVGMDEQTRARAFTPFFTTKGDHGTGLGLVIVHQIVARAGGRVTIDSEVGRGTDVHIYLPRIAGAA
ncbi:MAG TPA: ATP-binding protein [Steroidobacteraceae bacterium]|nr:ATP-binding protein [Steroidobacteraceae bacterium]